MRHRRAFAPIPTALLGLALLAAPASGATFLDSWAGTPVAGGSARGIAMGGTGASLLQGPSAAWQNPALLSRAPQGALLQFQGAFEYATEDRFVPLYDTFGSYVAETAFAAHRQAYATGEGGLQYGMPGDRAMGLAVGLFERYDPSYSYFEEVRDPDFASDPNDAIIQRNEIESDGRLRSLSAGYGAELLEGVSLGASLHYLFGELDRTVREAPTGGDPTVRGIRRDLSGIGFGVGLVVNVEDRVDLALAWDAAARLEGTHDGSLRTGGSPGEDPSLPADGDYAVDLPHTITFGGSYHPRNELATVFSLELARRLWEDATDEYLEAGADPLGPVEPLRDTWDVRVGLEHVFYDGTPLRIGFRYLENHADEESYRSIFSAGTGYAAAGFTVDVTGSYQRQTSRQGYLFDPATPGFSSEQVRNKVEDSVLGLVLGVSRAF